MKWVVNKIGKEQVWYSKDVVDEIKEIVQETINKRPHSDNTIFENILEIIKEADGDENS